METPRCCQYLKATAQPPDQCQDTERFEVLDGHALAAWMRQTLGDDAFNRIEEHPKTCGLAWTRGWQLMGTGTHILSTGGVMRSRIHADFKAFVSQWRAETGRPTALPTKLDMQNKWKMPQLATHVTELGGIRALAAALGISG